ncbi:hypothetical protein [Staphylococcus gallinarum]|uniref:hypothetical protein n=1 Tax=Staphylococcus gallinarum TaxID=1293 RepID=UPI003F55B57D
MPVAHDGGQNGYGLGDYNEAKEHSKEIWDNPNAHAGGPGWVGKNEGYESWRDRQIEVEKTKQVE